MTTDERDALVTDNLRLARFIANRFMAISEIVPRDDIESAALFGLIQAALRFDPESGNKFSAFAWSTIRGVILTEIRRLTHGGRALHIMTEIDADKSGSLADSSETAARLEAQIDARRQTASLIARLSRRSKLIIHMRFVEEKPIGEIANRFNICEGRVSRIISEALDTMRKPLAECHVSARRRIARAAYDAKRKEKKAA